MTAVDMLGQPCPLPVIAAKKALRAARPGDLITILVDNDIAVQNLAKMALALGHEFKSSRKDQNFEAVITVREGSRPESEAEAAPGGLAVAISRNTMGQGDDTLGQKLLAAFIFSLTELDTAPEYLLFFNGGIFLTTEGSPCLKDLQTLAGRGTVISTCGACLDFYQRKDKLAVGAVTNMYAIASTMGQARRLINI
jgi:selenium metabolism protein YedF